MIWGISKKLIRKQKERDDNEKMWKTGRQEKEGTYKKEESDR